MSDLDRILKLAGFDETQGQVEEKVSKTYHCKDCGCEMHNCDPGCDCPHDSHDEKGSWWRDEDGNGVPDVLEREMKEDDMEEAVGQSAEAFYEMQDMYAGGECPSKPHETIIDELVRFLSGDQVEDFVEQFRRHHMDMGDEMFKDDVDLDEDDLDENAFNQAAADAARKGESHFTFNGKKYKTSMDKATAHKLDDDVQMESEEDEDLDEASCSMKKKKYEDVEADETEEVVSEAPTIDTTQLITLLKNAGLSEAAIEEKLNEWANTPDNIGEVEAREHGDAYDFAQGVNLSLKRYLDAEDHKVQVKEHTVEDMKAMYEAKKNS